MTNASVLTYSTNLATIGSPNGTVILAAPIQWDGRIRRYFRLIKCNFSSLLANISTLYGNNTLQVSRNGGTSWTTISFKDGSYSTVYQIELAVNAALSAWWTDPTQPGFQIRGNPDTNFVYITLDSTKLAAPGTQLGIDLSISLIWDFLGYSNPLARTFIVDGEYDAPSYANVNYFGDSISLVIKGFGPLSIKNGSQSFEAADIPLILYSGTNEYIYPIQGIPSPKIPLPQCPPLLTSFDISLLGSRTNAQNVQYPIYILQGNVNVQFEIFW